MSRRVGDRDRGFSGSVKKYLFERVDHGSQLKSYFADDRARVNSARTTRTRFYPARITHVGIETAMPGDCVEMNPAATLLNLSNDGRNDQFRYLGNRNNLYL